MINILLSGGSGKRLWPLSRASLPKQFVRLFDNYSLFQEALKRNASLCSHTIVVSNLAQYFLALDQVGQLEINSIEYLLEPLGRNTAPAIALACMMLEEDELVLVSASDHLINNLTAYENAVSQARVLAEKGFLVTFGIQPDYPETGFGYIETCGNDVLSFQEKPDEPTAQSFIEEGSFLWNSGMFCFKAGVLLSELKRFRSDIFEACLDAMPSYKIDNQLCIDLAKMSEIPEESIDVAVMESSDKVKVIPCDIGWSDLGSFEALSTEFKKPNVSNSVISLETKVQEPICLNSSDNLIVSGDKQIALIDVNDLLIVDTSDALLVSKKGRSYKIKEVVEKIQKSQPEIVQQHRFVHRPWGTYEVLLKTATYKVKRIVVKPSGRLSLQKHLHRNEHWVVLSGNATVTVDNQQNMVRSNQSMYIKMGQLHRLENEGSEDLVIIEVQVGDYIGEDDIIRLDDIYGR